MSIYVNVKKNLGNFSLNINFSAQNEILGILGSSGCGKSMTLKCISGIVTPDEGEIILNDKILFSSEKKINLSPQKRNVGLMFQNYALFPNMTVEQNISIGISKGQTLKKDEIVNYYLELLQLAEYAKKYPRQLSGGQQQRVALARMMAKSPDILMLDEPFSALDSELRYLIETEFLKILKNYNQSVIYVSHSIDEVYTYCDRTAIMSDGRLLEIGATHDIFDKPATMEGAKLTGCKNISRIKKAGEYLADALDWGIMLETSHPICNDIKYIGIRESDIRVSQTPNGQNCFNLSIPHIKQTPSGTIMMLRPDSLNGSCDSHIICTYAKDKAAEILSLQECSALYGSIDKDRILLLK